MNRTRHLLSGLFVLVVALVVAGAEKEDKPELKLSKGEQAVLDQTNKEREKEKLPPLKANAQLFKAARSHTDNMARTGEFKHELDGKTPADRVKDVGYKYSTMGENIAYGTGLSPKDAVKLWMESPPHKENLLKEDYQEIGIGIAKNEKGEVYYTQVFGTQRK